VLLKPLVRASVLFEVHISIEQVLCSPETLNGSAASLYIYNRSQDIAEKQMIFNRRFSLSFSITFVDDWCNQIGQIKYNVIICNRVSIP
jgi:hypothetical protein